jgi:hypothetical protein
MGQAKKTEATAGSVALAKRDFTVAGFAPAVEEAPAGRVGKDGSVRSCGRILRGARTPSSRPRPTGRAW